MERILPYLDSESMALLRPKMQLARAAAGKRIISQGRRSPGLFVVRSGSVDIFRETGGNEIFVTTLGIEQMFGESAFLDSLPASALVKAREDADLLVMTPAKLQPLFEQHPRLFSQFYRSLALHLSRKLRGATGEVNPGGVDRFGDVPCWEIL